MRWRVDLVHKLVVFTPPNTALEANAVVRARLGEKVRFSLRFRAADFVRGDEVIHRWLRRFSRYASSPAMNNFG